MIALAEHAPARPLARAILLLAGLGAFFYASYGFSNWLAGTRETVPSIVFDWERHIPFLSWTIVPYWSTNVFYAASLLFSRTRLELDTHAKRLVTAQLVAVFFFIVAPLKFSWPKPDTSGLFGFMFEALGAFDKPFNQAPSLHIALTVILIAHFVKLLPRRVLPVFLAWSVLVVASVLTTFQHHFIDIPTGALLGLFCLWLWREDGSNAFATAGITRDPKRLKLAGLYAGGALLFVFAALALGGAWLWLFWPALSMLLVAAGYAVLGPAVFLKDANGAMGWPARLMLAPYLAAAWMNSRLWTRGETGSVEIADNVHLGRYPDARAAAAFREVIDLAAELPAARGPTRWKAIPMLDLVAPEPKTLREAALAIEVAQGVTPVLVCCALGYGRSAGAIIVWLVLSGRARDMEEAIAQVRMKRPRMAIGTGQMQAIEKAIHGD